MASHNAGVTVVVVAIGNPAPKVRRLFAMNEDGETVIKDVPYINAYLVPGANVVVDKATRPLSGQSEMNFGNKPVDGGNLLLASDEVGALRLNWS